MKKILGVLLTSTILTSAAFSNAGPAAPAPAPAAPCASCPAPVITWGGFKLGAQLGYGQAESRSYIRISTQNIRNDKYNKASTSILGGIHLGWDYQFATNWIMGINTSFDFNGFKASSRLNEVNGGQTTNIYSSNAKSQYTVAVVPRVGCVYKDAMFYAGAGWAGSNWKLRTSITDNTDRNRKSEFLSALRLSVGAVQRMNRVLLGVEVNYDAYSSIVTKYNDGVDSFRNTHKPRVLSGMVKASYMLTNATTN